MSHFTTPQFWDLYNALPQEVRDLADRCFALLQQDPSHPSLRFKKVGRYWSARVGLHYRVLAREREEGMVCSGSGHTLNTTPYWHSRNRSRSNTCCSRRHTALPSFREGSFSLQPAGGAAEQDR